jgi:hypothetical protein
MTITFDQGEDSTLSKLCTWPNHDMNLVFVYITAVFSLAGVPKGQEETLEKAIDTYYVRG